MRTKLPIKNIENYLYALHNTAKVVILLLDEKANILYVNQYIQELSGYERDFLIGKIGLSFLSHLPHSKI